MSPSPMWRASTRPRAWNGWPLGMTTTARAVPASTPPWSRDISAVGPLSLRALPVFMVRHGKNLGLDFSKDIKIGFSFRDESEEARNAATHFQQPRRLRQNPAWWHDFSGWIGRSCACKGMRLFYSRTLATPVSEDQLIQSIDWLFVWAIHRMIDWWIDWLIDWVSDKKIQSPHVRAVTWLVFFQCCHDLFFILFIIFLAREVRNQTQGRKAGGDPAEPHLQWAADWMVQSRQRSQPHGRCFCCGREQLKKIRPSRGPVKPLISLCVVCFCAAVTVVWESLDFTTAVYNFHVRKAHFSFTWFFLFSHPIVNSAFRILFHGRKFGPYSRQI